jgi:hypothetical protein
MSSFTSLPEEVLKAITALVSFKDRLTSCCLVSRRLHAAAVAATECLELPFLPRQRVGSLPGWLSQYGKHLTTLRLGCSGFTLEQLPCPMLLELQVSNDHCEVRLEAIQQCTMLTRLELECNITHNHKPYVADCLSSLAHLQHLRMLPTLWECGLSCATLQRLQCLTYLDVDGLSAENLLQLGGLSSLQELHLRPGRDVATVFGLSSVSGLEFPPFLKKLFLPSFEADRHIEAD